MIKGEASGNWILYLMKAKCEMQETLKLSKCIGFDGAIKDLIGHDIMNMNDILKSIDDIMSYMCLNTDVNGSVVLENIVVSIAKLNWFIKQFNNLGLELDCDSFDGHMYNALSSLVKSIDLLCCIAYDDDVTHFQIDNVTMSNYGMVSSKLFQDNHDIVVANMKQMTEKW